MKDYQQQAKNFAQKYNVKLIVVGEPEYRPYFKDDAESRYVFKLRLTRNGRKYTFTFGQSISSGAEEPDLYDVFSCLTKYDPGDFENFCSDFGYDTDSRTAERIYKSVCKEWGAMNRLFPDSKTLEEMADIN
jgi:hypothetical protein